jgi:hypothetical protein
MLLRSKTFPCPTCKEALRPTEWNPLWGFPLLACGWTLTYVGAERMGLEGWGLLFATILLGFAAAFLIPAVIALLLAWVFNVPPSLERDPGPALDDGGVLHIDSPPGPQKPPQ